MTLLHRLSRSGGAHVKKFATARDGLAAVEFAIISPLLITMYFGVTEIADAFTASTKATTVASTAAVRAGNRTDQREIPKSFKERPANQMSNGGL